MRTKKKIFFINSWGERPVDLLKRYSKQTPNVSGQWKNIIAVDRPELADYYIFLGGRYDTSKINLEKSIYVKREPNFIEPYDNTGFIHEIKWADQHCGITWWIGKTYDELKALEPPRKEKLISCIVSSKHAHRLRFVEKLLLLENSSGNIDLYGRGHGHGKLKSIWKGELNYDGKCKFRGISPYTYTIALENSQEKNYWTEKLADAFLSWTIPIYWGCPNLDDFFDMTSIHYTDLKDVSSITKMWHTTAPILTEQMVDSIKINRDRILDEYNIWEVVRSKISEIENV